MTLAQLHFLIEEDPEFRAARTARLQGAEGIDVALYEAARLVS